VAWNLALVACAVLVASLGLFHSIAGERYIIRRLLRRADLPRLFGGDSFTRLTLRYAWHLLTIFCLLAAAVLVAIAAEPIDATGRVVAQATSVGLAVAGLWGLVATRGRHLSWVALFAAAALAWFGTT